MGRLLPATLRRRPASGDALLTNSSVLLVGRLVVAGLGWTGTVLIVRHLSTTEWGQFAFIFSFLALISVLTDLGVGRIAIGGLLDEEQDRDRWAGTYVVL